MVRLGGTGLGGVFQAGPDGSHHVEFDGQGLAYRDRLHVLGKVEMQIGIGLHLGAQHRHRKADDFVSGHESHHHALSFAHHKELAVMSWCSHQQTLAGHIADDLDVVTCLIIDKLHLQVIADFQGQMGG
jgi:hypothetical protein